MKTCVIYDETGEYGKRLLSGLIKKAQNQFNLMLFTGKEELEKYLKEGRPDLLLVSEDSMNEGITRLYRGNIIILTEEPCVNEEMDFGDSACYGIYRYQSVERIFNEIVVKGGLKRNTRIKTLDIIGVYSPVYVEGKQSFVLNLAKIMSEKYKTLYINLEEFSGLGELLPAENQYTLSDALYFYRQNGKMVADKIGQTINSVSGVDYIPPVMCAEDLSYVDSKELITFFEQLGNMFGYEMIVVDISTAVRQPWDMLDMCSTVYIPEKSDYISKEKLKCFETYYSSIGREYSFDRFELIRLPEGDNDMKPDFWEKCGYSGMCRYVRKMLEKDGDTGAGE